MPDLRIAAVVAIVTLVAVADGRVRGDDTIEFLSGAKAEGRVTKIDKEARQITFEALVAGKTFSRVYPYSMIHAVTYQGKRYVLNEASQAKSKSPAAAGSQSARDSAPSGMTTRSSAEIKKLIDEAGRSPPGWYDTAALDYPRSLDLSWPAKPPEGWNNQKNVGQYLWDIVNPNPGRWQSGVRLIHHLLSLHKDDPEKRQRAMQTLGGMYFNLFQDYARAAFWWQEAGVSVRHGEGVALAECYFRLGNKKMAADLLVDPERPRPNSTLRVDMIKLWGDMGEPTKATKLADWYVKSGGEPHLAHLLAGDACRYAGRFDEAIRRYQTVIDTPPTGKGKVDQTIKRAQASLDAVRQFELSDVRRVKDGQYRSSSLGYEGPVEVEVTVRGGRIEDLRVTRHTEKQFYSALADVPQQILRKQGVKGVDATSRATITGEAIINAAAKALASGAR